MPNEGTRVESHCPVVQHTLCLLGCPPRRYSLLGPLPRGLPGIAQGPPIAFLCVSIYPHLFHVSWSFARALQDAIRHRDRVETNLNMPLLGPAFNGAPFLLPGTPSGSW